MIIKILKFSFDFKHLFSKYENNIVLLICILFYENFHARVRESFCQRGMSPFPLRSSLLHGSNFKETEPFSISTNLEENI